MITINLLPEEFRVKKKRELNVPGVKIAIVVGAIFGLMTLWNFVDLLFAGGKLKKVEAEWQSVQPESQELNKLQQEVEGTLRPEKDFLANFVATGRPLTHFLTWVSEYLPTAAWLTEVRMERAGEGGDLLIKGLCLSTKEKSSIEQIETFLHELKTKMPDAELSLTTTRQTYEGVELTQFMANFHWSKQELV